VVLVVPPQNLVRGCEVLPPPDIRNKAIKVQRDMLVESWIDQTIQLKMCNYDKSALSEWVKRQEGVLGGKR